jgi:hypothetical protein
MFIVNNFAVVAVEASLTLVAVQGSPEAEERQCRRTVEAATARHVS